MLWIRTRAAGWQLETDPLIYAGFKPKTCTSVEKNIPRVESRTRDHESHGPLFGCKLLHVDQIINSLLMTWNNKPTIIAHVQLSWYKCQGVDFTAFNICKQFLAYHCGTVWPDWVIYWTLVNFLKPLATINLPKSLTFFGNFCKGVKIYHFSSEIIFGKLL